jgi:hypothetical protein
MFAWTLIFLAYVSTNLSKPSPSTFTDCEIQIFVSPLFFPQAYNYWAHLGLEIVTNIFWLSSFALLADEAAGWDIVDDFGFDEFLPPKWNSAIAATKAAAGLGALEWALFIVTLITFSTSLPPARSIPFPFHHHDTN